VIGRERRVKGREREREREKERKRFIFYPPFLSGDDMALSTYTFLIVSSSCLPLLDL
jgi:hypothetical protein